MKKSIFPLIIKFCFLMICTSVYGQQANLSFQGILKRANGTAVEDGEYSITFKLYESESGGNPIWTETQPNVEVTSGIYSVILGTITPIDAGFNVPYWLGVTVGSTELTPRFRLTSAPYALSLLGESNTFPSTGAVVADNLKVKPGTPDPGTANKGYSFSSGGDQDGGLFSQGEGNIGLYVNGAIRVDLQSNPSVHNIIYGPLTTNTQQVNGGQTVTGNQNIGGNQTVSGNQSVTGNITLGPNSKIIYDGGFNDWRMVYQSDFSSGIDGWEGRTLGTGIWGESTDPIIPATKTIENNPFFTDKILQFSNGIKNGILRRKMDLNGKPHSEVKVEFTYYFFGSWDGEIAFGGFQNTAISQMTPAWFMANTNRGEFPTIDVNLRDKSVYATMVTQFTGNELYIVLGSEVDNSDENFAIGNIKVWIR